MLFHIIILFLDTNNLLNKNNINFVKMHKNFHKIYRLRQKQGFV